jgi:hypothetical protein
MTHISSTKFRTTFSLRHDHLPGNNLAVSSRLSFDGKIHSHIGSQHQQLGLKWRASEVQSVIIHVQEEREEIELMAHLTL